MKTLFTWTACALFTLTAAAQDTFSGKRKDFNPWLAAQMTCPAECDAPGTVVVKFTITDMVPGLCEVLQDPAPALTAEVLRVLQGLREVEFTSAKGGQAALINYYAAFRFGEGEVTPQTVTQPGFTGGEGVSFERWMADELIDRLTLPKLATENPGTIRVHYAIAPDGSLVDAQVESNSKLATKELLKLLGQCPSWTPGNVAGQPLKMPRESTIAITTSVTFGPMQTTRRTTY